MQLGMVGLGRMGGNMTRRLVENGLHVVAYDRNPDAVAATEADGAKGVGSLADLVAALEPPRAVWVMVPSGPPTQATMGELSALLTSGDAVIDGGNSYYKHSMALAADLATRGIGFVDAGVSGGVWGIKLGYCLMVGGDDEHVRRLEPVFRALAPPDGYAHVGPCGAGHFVKMVHNGIEYGLLQAYAEGFALLESAEEFGLDLHEIAALWNHGSVVRSWLLELAELALGEPDEFRNIRGYVEDSGEGRWTVEESISRSVATPVITASLFARFASRDDERMAARIVAALRNQFGGHKFFAESEAGEVARDADIESGVVRGPETPGTGQ